MPPTRWTLAAPHSWEHPHAVVHSVHGLEIHFKCTARFFDLLYLNLYIYYTMNHVLNKSSYALLRVILPRIRDCSGMMRNLFRPLETVLNTGNCTIKKMRCSEMSR